MKRQDVFEAGKDRGQAIASWVDTPELGQEVPRELDWVGYRVVTPENQRDVFEMVAGEAEANSRDFSPFEFTAHDLNELPEDGRDPETGQFTVSSEEAWDAFNEGIYAGIAAEADSREFDEEPAS